jgi:lysophospholipase L1-like esterase
MGRHLRLLAAALGCLLAVVALRPFAAPGAGPAPTYLALGDSIAFGVGASDPGEGGYVALVYKALRASQRYRGQDLQLVNLSLPGATSADLVAPGGQLEEALGEIERRGDGVQIITIDIGGNDLLTLANRGSPCLSDTDTEECRRAVRRVLGDLQMNLTEVLRRLREASPDATIVVLDLYNPYSGTGDPRETIAELGVGQINGVIGAAAGDPALNVRLASVFQLFSGRGPSWIAPDGIHPNDSGHAVIAEVVLAAIDGRAPQIPADLLAPRASPTAAASAGSGGDGVPVGALLAAVVVSFAAGAAASGAYFWARGRA